MWTFKLEKSLTNIDIPVGFNKRVIKSYATSYNALSGKSRISISTIAIGALAVGALGVFAAPAIGGLVAPAGLFGAAATSAGLAALGGGALAVGGFGMLGGTVVVVGGAAAFGAAGGAMFARYMTKNINQFTAELAQAESLLTQVFLCELRDLSGAKHLIKGQKATRDGIEEEAEKVDSKDVSELLKLFNNALERNRNHIKKQLPENNI